MRQFSSSDTSAWREGFGTGKDGALVVGSNTTFSTANQSCSGTSGSKTLTLGSAGTFANGDLILIHQSRGTGVGNWELNKINTGAGTTTLSLKYNLQNTYTDSGASQAQVLTLPQYSSVDVQSGFSLSAPEWDGNTGGIIAFMCRGDVGGEGTINLNGTGFRGGAKSPTSAGGAFNGENTTAASAQSTSAAGNGGASSRNTDSNGAPGGGGGGHAAAGSDGDVINPTGSIGGGGGSTSGSATMATATFGGGGGGGGCNDVDSDRGGAGGDGGGLLFCFGHTTDLSSMSVVRSNGANGQDATSGGGGGGGAGAGGGLVLKGYSVNYGTSKLTVASATGGNGNGSGGSDGGDSSVGRIRVEYNDSVTGSSTPSASEAQDSVLLNTGGMIGGLVI